MRTRNRILFAILLCASGTLHAAPLVFQQWNVDVAEDKANMYAGTVNESGSVLMQSCEFSSQNCMWVLGIASVCESNNVYPVLVNADTGSAPLKVMCDGQGSNGIFRYAFSPFDDIDGIVKGAKKIGFAFPMQGDQFKVVRFDLAGANVAITTMRSLAEKKKVDAVSKPKGTRDQDL